MTTPDPWQGTGRDPWLPSRLESRLHMSDAEHDIRTAFWAALAGWLTQTARRVLRTNERPDVRAIWAAEPAWREVVQEVVQGEIRTALGLAYVRLLGDAFPWDSRPFVAGYLAEVVIPIRCRPALGVHEHCEHVRPVPSFREIPTFAQLGAVTS